MRASLVGDACSDPKEDPIPSQAGFAVLVFLLFGAMPEERVHGVHLGVGRARIGPTPVDLTEDRTSCREIEAHTAVFLWYESAEVTGLGHRRDELLWVK